MSEPLERLTARCAELLADVAARDSLAAPDPYDMWATPPGRRLKDLYNRNRLLGVGPAALATAFDLWINNRLRIGLQPREYPVVRAQTALACYRMARIEEPGPWRALGRHHLTWLDKHALKTDQGVGWGLGFDWAVDASFQYPATTPLSTMTPYALMAFAEAWSQEGLERDAETVQAILGFFLHDLEEMPHALRGTAMSYAPFADRIVLNANAYTMYSLCLAASCLPEGARDGGQALERARDIADFLVDAQREDGAYPYALAPHTFIDGFHTCIQLRLMNRVSREQGWSDLGGSVDRGWTWAKEHLLDPSAGLCRRFAEANRPNPVRWELYDSAEMLATAWELDDHALCRRLAEGILATFFDDRGVSVTVDVFGARRNRGALRWGLVPLLRAVSEIGMGRGEA